MAGALFGAFVVINLWQPKLDETKEKNDSFHLKSFSNQPSPKKKAKKSSSSSSIDQDLKDMEKQMKDVFKSSGGFLKIMEDSIQGAAMDNMGVNIGEIVEKITPNEVILEMDVSNIDNSTLNIEVKNGQVMISGEARVEQKERGSTRVMVSSFSRSVPVPKGTNASGLRIENEGSNTLQMVFPKEK